METIPVKKSKTKKVLKIVGLSFLTLIIVIVGVEFLYKDSLESPMYKVQQYLTYSKEDWANYENIKKMRAEAEATPASNTTDVVSAAPESPIDTTMWESSIKNKEFMPEGELEEINRYKKRDFYKGINVDPEHRVDNTYMFAE